MTTPQATHLHAGSNDPGCMPDSEPECFDRLADAVTYIAGELRSDADTAATWCDGDDADDFHADACPTCGAVSALESTALWLEDSDPSELAGGWGEVVAGRSYWIMPSDEDCQEDKVDAMRPGSGPGAMLATRPVWNSSRRSLADVTPADLARYRDGQRVAHNTYVEHDSDGSVGVRFHSTRILTFHPDGSFTVNTGGYRTVTTKQRLNALLPAGYRIYQVSYVWRISTPEGDYLFEDRDTWKG